MMARVRYVIKNNIKMKNETHESDINLEIIWKVIP